MKVHYKLNLLSLFIPSLLLLASACSPIHNRKLIDHAERQSRIMLTEISKAENQNGTLVSPRTLEGGKLKLVASKDWTSGFFAGQLWYLFELSKDPKWEKEARNYTVKIEKEKLNGSTHDMGFKIYCSCGNGYRLTAEQKYKDVIIQSAKTLSTRFNPIVGAIRSWDHNQDKWQYPVIIDNMLNLELLFAATKLTGDSSFYKIAVTHANTTLKNHFRPDFSTWHVVGYDPLTGAIEKKSTHQGYTDESAWARGQAWALYGFTMCFRETKNPQYLQQAEKIAKFIFSNKNLPIDLIPYWDFDAPGIPDEPRDVSAAAIIASALYELSVYSEFENKYRLIADKMVKNITSQYRSARGANKGFILDHSTGHKPHNSEINVPINYADYYYIEALIRANRQKNKQPVVQ